MSMIIRNRVRYAAGGGGNVNIVKLTQAEYDALPDSKYSDGILYAIEDGEVSGSGGGSAKAITLSQEEFDALSEEEKASGIYVIPDGEDLTAKNLFYDGSETGLGNTVQDAIDNVNKNLTSSDNLKFRFATDGEGKYGYLAADDSFIPFKSGVDLVNSVRKSLTWTNVFSSAIIGKKYLIVASCITYGSGYTLTGTITGLDTIWKSGVTNSRPSQGVNGCCCTFYGTATATNITVGNSSNDGSWVDLFVVEMD